MAVSVYPLPETLTYINQLTEMVAAVEYSADAESYVRQIVSFLALRLDTPPDLIAAMGAAVRDYRTANGLTQE